MNGTNAPDSCGRKVTPTCRHSQDDPDPLGALAGAAQRYRCFAKTHPDPYGLIFDRAIPGWQPFAAALAYAAASFGRLAGHVPKVMAAGALAGGDPAEVAQRLWSAFHGVVSLELRGIGFVDDIDAPMSSWSRRCSEASPQPGSGGRALVRHPGQRAVRTIAPTRPGEHDGGGAIASMRRRRARPDPCHRWSPATPGAAAWRAGGQLIASDRSSMPARPAGCVQVWSAGAIVHADQKLRRD